METDNLAFGMNVLDERHEWAIAQEFNFALQPLFLRFLALDQVAGAENSLVQQLIDIEYFKHRIALYVCLNQGEDFFIVSHKISRASFVFSFSNPRMAQKRRLSSSASKYCTSTSNAFGDLASPI